ncbi:MAG: MmgE/PrpD family protein [Chloroflexi bacterium]|nr:MmgE/PrpD family protein [Chloroflexota bacterium]
MGTTLDIAQYVVDTNLEDIPKEAVERAKELLVDFVGTCVAGAPTFPGRTVNKYVKEMGARPESTVIGSKFRTVAPYAAFANATLCHCNEMEDVGMRGAFAATHLLADALAMGEKLGSSGKEVLAAYILGHEVQGRISIACLPSSSKRIAPYKYGFLGCAATSAKLMKLDAEGVAMSIALAASQASGITPTAGTMSHYLDFRSAARSGVEAAILVSEGIIARKDILEGENCFLDEMVGRGDYDLPKITANWGTDAWQCTQVSIKKYTCCYVSHRPLDALLSIMKENNITYDDIKNVEVEVSRFHTNWMRFDEPANGDEARFSLKHALGSAILKGEVWVDSIAPEAVLSQPYKEARRKVKVTVHPEWPATRADVQAIVTVTLKDGRVFTKKAVELRELTRDELISQYKRLTKPLLTQAQQDRSLELMYNIEKIKNISETMSIVGGLQS